MSNNNNQSGGGVGFLGLLAIVFIALKLTGFITWSWWAVLAPIFVPIVLIITLLVVLSLSRGRK